MQPNRQYCSSCHSRCYRVIDKLWSAILNVKEYDVLPIHHRRLQASIRTACEKLGALDREIHVSLDAQRMGHGKAASARAQMAVTTLKTVSDQADAVKVLVLNHNCEAASPNLRTMIEAEVKLEYALLGKGDTRVTALHYRDAKHIARDYEETRRELKRHDKEWPGEKPMFTDNFKASITARLAELKSGRKQQLQYLEAMKPSEFSTNDGKVSKEKIERELKLESIVEKVDMEKQQLGVNANARVNNSMVYAILSRSVHVNTLDLAQLFTLRGATFNLGAISEEKNEENSLRAIFTAYGTLMDTYIETLKELGRDYEDIQIRHLGILNAIF